MLPNLLTPDEIRLTRESLGLSQSELADALCMGNDGARRVRAWEKGEREITGPASAAIRLMLRLKAMQDAMRRYLRPDSGITVEQFAGEIIGLMDKR